MTDNITKEKMNRAVLVGLHAHCLSDEENASEASLEELAALLETAGGESVAMVMQSKATPDPNLYR